MWGVWSPEGKGQARDGTPSCASTASGARGHGLRGRMGHECWPKSAGAHHAYASPKQLSRLQPHAYHAPAEHRDFRSATAKGPEVGWWRGVGLGMVQRTSITLVVVGCDAHVLNNVNPSDSVKARRQVYDIWCVRMRMSSRTAGKRTPRVSKRLRWPSLNGVDVLKT